MDGPGVLELTCGKIGDSKPHYPACFVAKTQTLSLSSHTAIFVIMCLIVFQCTLLQMQKLDSFVFSCQLQYCSTTYTNVNNRITLK